MPFYKAISSTKTTDTPLQDPSDEQLIAVETRIIRRPRLSNRKQVEMLVCRDAQVFA